MQGIKKGESGALYSCKGGVSCFFELAKAK